MIRVTVWNENLSETKYEDVAALFPKGIHGYLAVLFGKEADLDVRTATMDQPENGLPDEVLENTDVLIWWAHTGTIWCRTVSRGRCSSGFCAGWA